MNKITITLEDIEDGDVNFTVVSDKPLDKPETSAEILAANVVNAIYKLHGEPLITEEDVHSSKDSQ